jgi:hypothetical protein
MHRLRTIVRSRTVLVLRPPLVAELRGRVEVVMTWPVDDLATLDAVLATGANGIISSEPTVLRAVRSGRP